MENLHRKLEILVILSNSDTIEFLVSSKWEFIVLVEFELKFRFKSSFCFRKNSKSQKFLIKIHKLMIL